MPRYRLCKIGFGVDSIVYKCIGDYRVYLDTIDPYTGAQIDFSDGFSVTATSVVFSVGVPNYVVDVTQLGYGLGGTPNSFDIFIVTSGTPQQAVDGRVMFQVFGRQ